MKSVSPPELFLPPEALAPLAEGLSFRCEPGQMIYLQDTPAACFYYLKRGRVRTFSSSADGAEQVLQIYGPGMIFGEAAFFDGLPRMSSAVAVAPCELAAIDHAAARAALGTHPELAMALLQYLARTVRLLSGHLEGAVFLRPEQRVARFLLSAPTDRQGRVACTQEEIAASVGTSRVTVSRVLSRFARQGWVRTGYGWLDILDPAGLESV